MHDLSSALYTNSSLKKLTMDYCNLGDNGCIYLMDGCERNVILQEISLKSNGIRH